MNEIASFPTGIDPAVLAARLSDERAPDIVEALNDEAPEVAAAILLGLPVERAIEVLDQPELDCAADIIEMLPRDRVASYLSGMSADRITDLFREIEEPGRSDLRARLDAETRGRRRPAQHLRRGDRRLADDHGVRRRAGQLDGAADPRSRPSGREDPRDHLRDLRPRPAHPGPDQGGAPAPADLGQSGRQRALGGARTGGRWRSRPRPAARRPPA